MDMTLLNIKEFNQPSIDYLYKKGIIGYEAKERLDIYTYYWDKVKEGINKMEAFELTAIKFNKSSQTIRGIVYKLNKPCTNSR